jgi:hypothetical protein
VPHVTFNVNDVSICASQLPQGTVERTWVTRYNAVVNNAQLVQRQLMNPDDYGMIVKQLFPKERGYTLKSEHFQICMAGLGEEGILPKGQTQSIAKVSVTTEEFDYGTCYTERTVDQEVRLSLQAHCSRPV